MIRIERPRRPSIFPLVAEFVHTGEAFNPWRCGACLTRDQRRRAMTLPLLKLVPEGIDPPKVCRKCSMDYR